MTRIAYQGGPGAYSTIAAQNYFGTSTSLEFVGHSSFAEVLNSVLEGVCNYAIIPVENTTTGFIQDYSQELFREIGEITVVICHCVLGLEGAQLSNITSIYSHPQALAQCKQFLFSYPSIKVVEHTDTALAAQKVSQDRNPSHAAIASSEAGSLYGLTVLARDIADKPNNKTRFVILERRTP